MDNEIERKHIGIYKPGTGSGNRWCSIESTRYRLIICTDCLKIKFNTGANMSEENKVESNIKSIDFEPRKPQENDVELQRSICGVLCKRW